MSLHNAFDTAPDRIVVFPASRHCDYYFDDGNLVILVENTLFNVHRSTFTRHSRVFRDLFTLPGPIAGPADHNIDVEGSSDKNPLQLLGISKVDFERLLWILYPPTFCKHRASSAEEWTSVLHLATRWEFDDIRAHAIQELEQCSLSPVDRILLSKEFDIDSQWALNAYTELCVRPNALTFKEASALGLEIVVRVSQLREKLRSGTGRMYSRVPTAGQPRTIGCEPLWEDRRINRQRPTVAVDFGPERLGRRVVNNRPAISKAVRPTITSRLIAHTFGLSL